MDNIMTSDAACTPLARDRAFGMSADHSWLRDPKALGSVGASRPTSVYVTAGRITDTRITKNEAAAAKQASPPRGEPR